MPRRNPHRKARPDSGQKPSGSPSTGPFTKLLQAQGVVPKPAVKARPPHFEAVFAKAIAVDKDKVPEVPGSVIVEPIPLQPWVMYATEPPPYLTHCGVLDKVEEALGMNL